MSSALQETTHSFGATELTVALFMLLVAALTIGCIIGVISGLRSDDTAVAIAYGLVGVTLVAGAFAAGTMLAWGTISVAILIVITAYTVVSAIALAIAWFRLGARYAQGHPDEAAEIEAEEHPALSGGSNVDEIIAEAAAAWSTEDTVPTDEAPATVAVVQALVDDALDDPGAKPPVQAPGPKAPKTVLPPIRYSTVTNEPAPKPQPAPAPEPETAIEELASRTLDLRREKASVGGVSISAELHETGEHTGLVRQLMEAARS